MTESLWVLCESTYFPRKLSLRSGKTKDAYRFACNSYSEHLGHVATTADLDDDLLTVWASRLIDSGLSIYTVREKVGRITALWNWLAKRRIVDKFPTFEKPTAPEPIPKAWSKEELRRLFESAQWEPGFVSGVLARKWWPALFAFAWSTAERRGACLALRWEWVDLQGAVATIPASVRKGRRKNAVYHLWPEVVNLLHDIRKPDRELVFPWDRSEGAYYYRFGRILERAELPNNAKSKTHSLRVSHATWCEINGGNASRALMHSSPETTRKSYIDARLVPSVESPLFVPWDKEANRPALSPLVG